MKRIIIFLILLFCTNPSLATTLKGSVVETKLPKGFFGTWRVEAEIITATDYSKFNPTSIEIWELFGSGDILILTNPMSGATSNIKIQDKNIEGKKLKFTRYKREDEQGFTVKYTESPEITLNNNIFSGTDTFIVEKYKGNVLLEKNVVKYKISGEKISGESKIGR